MDNEEEREKARDMAGVVVGEYVRYGEKEQRVRVAWRGGLEDEVGEWVVDIVQKVIEKAADREYSSFS